MLVKILLKIWPALAPWAIYFLWFLISKKLLPFLRKKNFIKTSSGTDASGFERNSGRIIDAEFVSHSVKQDQSSLGTNDDKASFTSSKHFIILLYLSLILAIISVISFAF